MLYPSGKEVIAVDPYVNQKTGRVQMREDAFGVELTPDGSIIRQYVIDTTACDPELTQMVIDRILSTGGKPSKPYSVLTREAIRDLSLSTEEKRPVIVFEVPYGPTLDRLDGVKVRLDRVRLTHTINYGELHGVLQNPRHKLHKTILIASHIANGLMGIRLGEGHPGLIKMPAGGVTNDEGILRDIPQEETAAYIIVGEITGETNAFAGEFADDMGIPFAFSSQEVETNPDRINLIRQLKLDPSAPDPRRISAVAQHLRLTAGRRQYSLRPTWYEALGVERHAKVSAPFRRTVSFINSHNLVAYLKGEEPPFQSRLLEEIVDALNRRAIKKQRASYLRAHKWEPKPIEGNHPSRLLAHWASSIPLNPPRYRIKARRGGWYRATTSFYGYRIGAFERSREAARDKVARTICKDIGLL